MKKTIRLSDAPARASGPRRPIMAVSVVSIATQASWVITMGAPRRAICSISVRQKGLGGRISLFSGERGALISKSLYPEQIRANRWSALRVQQISRDICYEGQRTTTNTSRDAMAAGRKLPPETGRGPIAAIGTIRSI